MFPPIDDAVFQNNPKFALLHKELTTTILNPDGSTKNHPAQAEREATSKRLHELRVKQAKSDILRASLISLPLASTSAKDQSLSSDSIELIIILSNYLSSPPTSTPNPHTTILHSSPLYDTLPTHTPKICTLLSTSLHQIALPIARLLSPKTNTSFLHRQIASIPTQLLTLQSTLLTTKTTLSATRTSLIPLTKQTLHAYRQATTLLIQHLEQTHHGAYSRSSRQSAEYLSTRSQVLQYEASILELSVGKEIYTERVRNALTVYAEHLRDGRARLGQREREAGRVLKGYGVGREEGGGGKERTMVEVARVYGEMMAEVEEVRREVARLRAG